MLFVNENKKNRKVFFFFWPVLLTYVIAEMFDIHGNIHLIVKKFLSYESYVAAQKMNPGILGLALQQRQEKERLRCKQQGLPQQITPQVRGQIRLDLDELTFKL